MRRPRYVRVLALVASCVAAVSVNVTVNAAPAGAAAPPTACAALPGTDFTGIPGAATTVESATVVTGSRGYEYCDVRGTIEGRILFELQLPTRTWTQRYLQVGSGAFGGYLGIGVEAADGCAPLSDGGFAIGHSNTGHVGKDGGDSSWARDDLRARLDFGGRSEHLLSVSAKRIITAFYGTSPRHSYFSSCSNGGRQALAEAQRYPDDFDGIIAGAPGNLFAPLLGQFAGYLTLANRDGAGQEILGRDKLAGLHQAVLAECDSIDGLADGQIDDPRQCEFDPASVACPSGVDSPDCLTPAQVTTVRTFYAGARDRHGTLLYPGAPEPGSELGWEGTLVLAPEQEVPFAHQVAEGYLRDMAYVVNPPESFTLDDARFDAGSFARQRAMGRIYNAADPDLSAFRDSGGKLIMWQGWADFSPPRATLAYRQAIEDRMGGYAAVQRFSRLFMLPQVGHCGGGDAPDSIDLLTPMLSWVERGEAPTQVIAAQRDGDTVVRTRPVYNYPVQARYDGVGDINDAGSFHPVNPAQRPDDHIRWLGRFH